jgi:peptidyl-prolyl cis-trans isomerase C
VIRRFLPALMLLGYVATVNAQMLGPVATVNGAEISRSKLEAQVNHTINQRGMGSGGITQPGTYKTIQEEMLEQLIVQELLWQEAQRRDFVINDEEVEQQLQKMKSGFDNEQAFLFKIKEGGFTEATFREEIRQQRSAQRMVSEGIAAEISVNDADVETFYNENIDKMSSPEQLRARHILISPKSDDEEGERMAREKITALQKELDSGASFAVVAMENSEGPSAKGGGDLGFFGRGQMVPAFEEVVFALQPGDVSDVVETRFGYHIIKLEERRDAQTVPVEEAAERIRPYLSQQRVLEAVEKLIEELRSSAEIESVLAS